MQLIQFMLFWFFIIFLLFFYFKLLVLLLLLQVLTVMHAPLKESNKSQAILFWVYGSHTVQEYSRMGGP